MTNLYETDFCQWLISTSDVLRHKKFNELDIENLTEELDGMVRAQKNALKSNLRVLLMHLLKYKYQPERRCGSWRYTIVEHRRRVIDALEDSPSLKTFLSEIFNKAYDNARSDAAVESELPIIIFPKECPFTLEQSLDEEFLPNS